MRRFSLLTGILIGGALTGSTIPLASAARQIAPSSATVSGSAPRAVLDIYCVTCHNERSNTAGLALDRLDLAAVPGDADVWEKVVRKLRTATMPPPGARRPDAATHDGLIAWLEARLDAAAAANPRPGAPRIHRLNRAEYTNAIRDLFELEVDGASLLPPDDSAYGFDNIADVLGVSSSLQERYLSAAAKVSALAVGDPATGAIKHTYTIRQDASQNQHAEGVPFGAVGGMAVRHTFPLDADYDFRFTLARTQLGMMRGLEYSHPFEVSVDGRRVHAATIGGPDVIDEAFYTPTETGDAMEARMAVRVPVTAGPHTIGIGFVEHLSIFDTVKLQPFLRSSQNTFDWTGRPHILSLEVAGPFNATGPGETPSRRRIFACRPSRPRDELPCATTILSTFLRRAYRQPPADADLRDALALFREGRRDGTFETGIQRALQLILASPKFVFRAERDPANVAPGQLHRVGDLELASRLSFFLWSSIPDDELLTAASEGRLRDPAVLDHQVRRMLADGKSRALVTNFTGQWLQLRNVRSVLPNSSEFPDFDDNLRQAFLRETELFVESIIREDRNVLDLLAADYTYLNERLARHYGIRNLYGSRFRRVTIADDARKGLLGHGSILALTSHAERTSPVLRGKWVLENILGTPPPPPPPDVPALPDRDRTEKPKTMRELMSEHRDNPVCASCHKVMDPIGFAMENFDAVGAWRAQEAGVAIDASGELADGTRVDGVVALRKALLSRPEVFVGTMSEKLLTYALGRGLGVHDMPAVRAIVREAARNDYRFSSLVLGVVKSVPFQMRAKSQNELSADSSQLSAPHADNR